jgi:hypothetical protein
MADTDVLFDQGADTVLNSTDSASPDSPYALLAQSTAAYLIREGLGSQPSGTTPQNFIQRFRVVDDFGGGSVTFKLYRLAEPWSDATTWAELPATTGSPVTLTGAVAAGDVLEFDVTTIVSAALATPETWYGFKLIVDTASVSGRVYTLSASDGILGDDVTALPTLSGTFSVAPPTPIDLQPSGGRAVAVTKPVVEADFGDTEIIAVQVQQKATNTGFVPATGFSSPAFDSGTVVTTDPSLDLSTTAFAGFGASASYWTIRVKNADGVWSLYADPVATRYLPRMTTTTVNQTPPTWSDPQVTISWNNTGGTQIAYRVITYDDADHLVPTSDSGVIAGTATSYTPTTTPEGDPFLLPDARLEYYEVHTFDNVADRQATPGVPVYYVASGTLQYAEDLTLNAPDNVTVAQIGDSPFNAVYVTVHSAPDGFVLKRDGLHVKRVDVADLADPEESEGGLTYRIVDYTAQPYEAHEYAVRNRNGHRTSHGTSTSIVATSVSGIWVADIAREVITQCAGMDISMQSNDQVAVLQGIGDPYVSVQQSSIGQRSGTLGGIVTDFAGVTASDWVKLWRDIKNHPTEVQIAYGDTNFPARIWNVLVQPVTDRVSAFDKIVSFEFAQSGKEHLADEPADEGTYEELWDDFEAGTSGNSLSGDTFVLSKAGGAQYLTGAAMHGVMGGDSSVGGGTWCYKLLNPYAFSVSAYYKCTYPASGRSVFHKLQTLSGDDLFSLRLKNDGIISLFDNSGTPVLMGKSTNPTAASTPFRVDMWGTWDGRGLPRDLPLLRRHQRRDERLRLRGHGGVCYRDGACALHARQLRRRDPRAGRRRPQPEQRRLDVRADRPRRVDPDHEPDPAGRGHVGDIRRRVDGAGRGRRRAAGRSWRPDQDGALVVGRHVVADPLVVAGRLGPVHRQAHLTGLTGSGPLLLPAGATGRHAVR